MSGGSVYRDPTLNNETAHTSHENSTIHRTNIHSSLGCCDKVIDTELSFIFLLPQLFVFSYARYNRVTLRLGVCFVMFRVIS
jgi:hypothetical protein